MRRLSLAIMITVFAFLVIVEAKAVIIYDSSVSSKFSGSAADGGVYAYEVFNEIGRASCRERV